MRFGSCLLTKNLAFILLVCNYYFEFIFLNMVWVFLKYSKLYGKIGFPLRDLEREESPPKSRSTAPPKTIRYAYRVGPLGVALWSDLIECEPGPYNLLFDRRRRLSKKCEAGRTTEKQEDRKLLANNYLVVNLFTIFLCSCFFGPKRPKKRFVHQFGETINVPEN